jgi:hypothetical protein
MPKNVAIQDTLTSFFYDLAKAIPVGTLNKALLNTIITDIHGEPVKTVYCDLELKIWAQKFAQQFINYETKFTQHQLNAMEAPMAVAVDRKK